MSQGQQDFRAMNHAMVARVLATPAQPIPAGGYALRVLEVAGRHSGRPARTTIGVLDHDGRHYLVCPDRSRDWPRNLGTAGRAVILAEDVAEPVRATEVTGRAAAEVVAAYLSAVTTPWAVAAFGLPPNATADDAMAELGRMAVFELIPDPDAA